MNKKALLIAAAVVAAAVLLGYPHLRWFQLRLDAGSALGDKGLGRFPTPDAMLAFPAALEQHARARGIKDLAVTQRLEERAAGPTTFWYLRVNLRAGSRVLDLERRIETRLDDAVFEQLEEGGLEVFPLVE